jgi:hypothetical protein
MNKLTRSIAQCFQRVSTLALVATTLVVMNPLKPVSARPIVIKDGVTFDFQECARTSDGNDVVCKGSFLSRKGEQTVVIGRGRGGWRRTFITNFKGKQYEASEIIISEDWSCRNDCDIQRITFVEGVSYSASFIFRDVSLPSSKIALFSIFADTDQKFRNINVNGSGKSSSQSSDSEADNLPTASTPDTPSPTRETVASNCPDGSQPSTVIKIDNSDVQVCGKF